MPFSVNGDPNIVPVTAACPKADPDIVRQYNAELVELLTTLPDMSPKVPDIACGPPIVRTP